VKAITLTQPWATLVAVGAKKIETRSWATAYRGLLAIHAAKGLGPVGGKDGLLTLCKQPPFRDVLRDTLPRGAILATCNLTAIYRIPATAQRVARCLPGDHPLASYPVVLPPFSDDPERAFGDYTPGRYAWLLEDVRRFDTPIEYKGALGLWTWNDADA